MKIISIVGNRPQFIKSFPLNQKLARLGKNILLHSGQHYDKKMSGIFFNELLLPKPDYFLGVGSGTHAFQTAEMLKGIEEILLKEKPDMVIVYGDTNTTLSGALSAVKLNIPVAHIEAGMRCGRKIPEEINRILVDHLSSLLFCSTEEAVVNLKKEGIRSGIYLVGDIMYDSFKKLLPEADKKLSLLGKYKLKPKDYYFMTVHRAENTEDGEKINFIFKAVKALEKKVIFPAHPRTNKLIKDINLRIPSNLKLIKPLSYLESIFLLKGAKGVLTDSGGLQKEAYFLKVPCFTLRNETEWTETVKSRWNHLVGTDPVKIVSSINKWKKPKKYNLFYGNGNASDKIFKAIDNWRKGVRI